VAYFLLLDPRLAHEDIWKDDIKHIGNGDISKKLKDKILSNARYVFTLLNSIDGYSSQVFYFKAIIL